LLGGLLIDFKQVAQPSSQPPQAIQAQPSAKQQTNSNVQQSSTGDGSPNVQGVQGDVTITADQSKGKTEAQKPAASKGKQENK